VLHNTGAEQMICIALLNGCAQNFIEVLGPSFFEQDSVIVFNLSKVMQLSRTIHVNITLKLVKRFKEIHQSVDDLCGLTKGFI